MPCVIGGKLMGHSSTPTPPLSCSFAMAAAAIVPAITCSSRTYKHNPIEHRLFPHISRGCQGVIFQSVQMLRDLIAKTTTRTGVKVYATVLDKTYETGRKVAKDFKQTMRIQFDDYLPQWNYTAQPQVS